MFKHFFGLHHYNFHFNGVCVYYRCRPYVDVLHILTIARRKMFQTRHVIMKSFIMFSLRKQFRIVNMKGL
jgi:hypothetical protein